MFPKNPSSRCSYEKQVKTTKQPSVSDIDKDEPDVLYKPQKYSPDGFWDGETIDDER